LAPGKHVFITPNRLHSSQAGALQQAGLQFCFEAGACADVLLNKRGELRPLERAPGVTISRLQGEKAAGRGRKRGREGDTVSKRAVKGKMDT
jgi:hypothetical protein